MAAIAAHSPVGQPPVTRPRARPAAFHIPSLDGLRACSFFLVFAAHAGLDRIVPGGFGVTVFFFLSGYLITSLMRVEAARTGGVSLPHFYLRRALRILPPFYIVLCVATALAYVGFLRSMEPLRGPPVLAQALHVSNYFIARYGWGGIASGTGVYWSLAVEEHFYVLFPTVFLALERLGKSGRAKAISFWTVCALVLAWRCILVLRFHAVSERTYLCSDTRIDSIAFGCALAVWRNPMLDGTADGAAWRPKETLRLAAAVAVLLVTFLVRGSVFRETFRYTLQGMALTPIFSAAVRRPEWWLFRPLNWKPLRFVGTLSYSLYLVHHCTLIAVGEHSALTGVARAGVALVLSIAIAWLIYRFVERPCARIRRRLSATE